jgi:hypothetical protein
MYFDELRPRTTKAAEYWNSAAPRDESIDAERFAQAISLLPIRSSSDRLLQAELQKVAMKLRQRIRQDDWGPGRGDQIAALRQIEKKIAELRSAVKQLSPSECDYFERALEDEASGKGQVTWAALMTSIEETAVLCDRQTGSPAFKDIAARAEYFLDYPARLDDNTQSAILERCAGRGLFGPAGSPHRYGIKELDCLIEEFAALHTNALRNLNVQRGPVEFLTLKLAVKRLAEIFKAETGREVTHYLDCSGYPASEAGKFIVAAILVMRPLATELTEEFREGLGKHASMWLSEPALKRQVAQILKWYVREVEKPSSRGRKRK